jgi:protein arginine kinase
MQLAEQQFLFDLQAIVGLALNAEEWGHATDARYSSQMLKQRLEHDSGFGQSVEPPSNDSESSSIAEDQQVRWVINLEDHLRLDVESVGNELPRNWRLASAIDDDLQHHLDFAFHPTFGFLTACPADAGTALRARVLLHLPAVIAMGMYTDLTNHLIRWNVAMREAFGDPGSGDFFALSNLSTLGVSESDLIEQVQKAVAVAVEFEHRAREKWRSSDLASLKREIQIAMADLLTLEIGSQDDQVRLRLIRALSRMRLGLQLQMLTVAEGAMVAAKFQLIWLKQRLELAIASEDYRSASQWRDRIIALGESR